MQLLDVRTARVAYVSHPVDSSLQRVFVVDVPHDATELNALSQIDVCFDDGMACTLKVCVLLCNQSDVEQKIRYLELIKQEEQLDLLNGDEDYLFIIILLFMMFHCLNRVGFFYKKGQPSQTVKAV